MIKWEKALNSSDIEQITLLLPFTEKFKNKTLLFNAAIKSIKTFNFELLKVIATGLNWNDQNNDSILVLILGYLPNNSHEKNEQLKMFQLFINKNTFIKEHKMHVFLSFNIPLIDYYIKTFNLSIDTIIDGFSLLQLNLLHLRRYDSAVECFEWLLKNNANITFVSPKNILNYIQQINPKENQKIFIDLLLKYSNDKNLSKIKSFLVRNLNKRGLYFDYEELFNNNWKTYLYMDFEDLII